MALKAQQKLTSGEASLISEHNNFVNIPKDPIIVDENGLLVDVFDVFTNSEAK